MNTDPPVAAHGHEERDVHVPAVIRFGVGLFLTLVLSALAMDWLFHYLSQSQSLGPAPTPFASERVLPPQPRLQVDPRQDLQQLRRSQIEKLNSYGWIDEKQGMVRIPIERAMDLVEQRGLPARHTSSPQEEKK